MSVCPHPVPHPEKNGKTLYELFANRKRAMDEYSKRRVTLYSGNFDGMHWSDTFNAPGA